LHGTFDALKEHCSKFLIFDLCQEEQVEREQQVVTHPKCTARVPHVNQVQIQEKNWTVWSKKVGKDAHEPRWPT